jgi:Arc/MetJ family transcription regulator
VTKRLVDIDDDLLEKARQAQGTSTIKDTVETALEESVRSAKRRSLTTDDIRRFVEATEDLRNPEIMAKAWE